MKIGIIVDKKKFNIFYNSIKKYLCETSSNYVVYLVKRVSLKEGETTFKAHILTSENTLYKRVTLPKVIINLSCKTTKETNKILKDLLTDSNYYLINYLNVFNQLRINELLLDTIKSDKIVKLSRKKRYENEIYTNLYGVKDFYADTRTKRYYYNNLFLDNIRGEETYINIFNDTVEFNNQTSSNTLVNNLIMEVFRRFHNNINIYKVTFLKTLNGDILHQITPFGYHNKDYKYIDQVIYSLFTELKDVKSNENI